MNFLNNDRLIKSFNSCELHFEMYEERHLGAIEKFNKLKLDEPENTDLINEYIEQAKKNLEVNREKYAEFKKVMTETRRDIVISIENGLLIEALDLINNTISKLESLPSAEYTVFQKSKTNSKAIEHILTSIYTNEILLDGVFNEFRTEMKNTINIVSVADVEILEKESNLAFIGVEILFDNNSIVLSEKMSEFDGGATQYSTPKEHNLHNLSDDQLMFGSGDIYLGIPVNI